ncbi:MAG TPA: amidase [Saprospiraceae bacterium]|nr:amidase [Saprospiraceae bacterium]
MHQRITICIAFFLLFCGSACQQQKSKNIDFTELTITDIHQAYQAGDYNSQQLVKAYLAAIEESNEPINAITTINPDALLRAKVLDEEFEQTRVLRPLHGIPILVKDNVNTKGMPTTAGSRALRDYYPEEDAFIIQKLKEAGAIILAKTNMAEWAFSPMHSESTTAGTTRNPYNLNYVPAGSSGGTGAAVAANLGLGGLGTDTGNSIRGPSSHNALVGFRTTLGLISREGIVPLYLRNDVVGPMCRTVEDATRMLEVMVGVDPKDPLTQYSNGKADDDYSAYLQANGLQGARIGVLRELSEDGADPAIKALFERAIADLDSLGAEIIDPIVIPDFAELLQDQWCASFRRDLEDFLATYVKNDTIKTLEDIMRIGTSSTYTRNRLQRNAEATGRWGAVDLSCEDAYNDLKRLAFRTAIERVMDSLEVDAIIYPSWNNKPARIDRFQEEYKGDNNQIISPHTGQPAFTVPMGFGEDNLPGGLQFLGRMYAEPTLIKLAFAYEQGTQHRRPPDLE